MRRLAQLTTLAVLLATAGIARAQTTFPLVCRGANSLAPMQYAIYPGSSSSWLMVYFTKGTQAYSAATLQPGQCTWLDRGLRYAEPAVLVQILPGTINTPVFLGVRGTLPPMAISTGGADAAKAPYFPLDVSARELEGGTPVGNTLFNSSQYYTFNVYNDGQGHLVIASVRCAGVCR